MSLPLAAVERLARKAGVDRISADAIKELERTVSTIGERLANEIATAAKHAKRNTILPKDVRIIAGKA